MMEERIRESSTGSLGSLKVANEDDLSELKSRLKDYVTSQTRMNDLHD